MGAGQASRPWARQPLPLQAPPHPAGLGTRLHALKGPIFAPACSAAEGEFAGEQASSRWRVLALVASFDCVMFLVRAAAKLVSGEGIARSLIAQLANMTMFHVAIAALNARSRRLGSRAAQQVGGGQRQGGEAPRTSQRWMQPLQ